MDTRTVGTDVLNKSLAMLGMWGSLMTQELTLERTIYRMLKHGRHYELAEAIDEGVTMWDTLTLDDLDYIARKTVEGSEGHHEQDAIYFRSFCDSWRQWNLTIERHRMTPEASR